MDQETFNKAQHIDKIVNQSSLPDQGWGCNPEQISVPEEVLALDRQLSAYDYELPQEQIAQNPVEPRDAAQLLVVDTPSTHQHRVFRDLPQLLRPGDLLVLNDTRVLPARLYGKKSSGAHVEILLLEEKQSDCWLALVKPGKRLQVGTQILFDEAGCLQARVLACDEVTGGRILQFSAPEGTTPNQWLERLGQIPLPPYITSTQVAPERYQTIYAERLGAAAAPTAGLHFTPELLERLQRQGIRQTFVTLHVGVGTFRPVEVEDITTHQIHGEWAEVPATTIEAIAHTQAQGGRVIAVGTTVTRALEAAAQAGTLRPFQGKTDLFIYPGYQWRVVEGLITNFHLPRSSLLMLVSALVGRQRLLALYERAIAHHYRFYSFGDAMLILPEARIQR